MSNTLKLGNGKWATGKDTLLGYNSENNNIKPLPFSFSRASSGTVVNKDGLIETVGIGEPRIDFKDNTKGALLLEPSRSNVIPYSEDFSNSAWRKIGSTEIISNNSISPDGSLNSDKVNATTTNNGLLAFEDGFSVSSGSDYSVSFFAKKGNLRYLQLFHGSNQVVGNSRTNFDLENGVVTVSDSGHAASVEDYGNGWFRCIVVLETLSTTLQLYFSAVKDANATRSAASNFNENDNILIWGAQLESGSYATSYIPTSGSAVTRVADACTNGGNAQVINSTEGVLYYEATYIDGSGYNSIIVSNSSGSEKSRTWYDDTNLIFASFVNNVNQTLIAYPIFKNINYKIAIRYKLNDFALYVNGNKATNIVVNLGGVSPQNSYNKLSFNSGDIYNKFFGNIKNLKLYNTALTDAELAALTTI